MTENVKIITIEELNRPKIGPSQIDLEQIKNKINEFIDEAQYLSNNGMDSLLDDINKYLIDSLENLHVNNKMKEDYPLLYKIYKKQNKYPNFCKFTKKRIDILVNKYKNEFKNGKLNGGIEFNNFIINSIKNENEKQNPNYRKIEILRHIQGVLFTFINTMELSNKLFNNNKVARLEGNVQFGFNKEELKKLLINKKTTIKDLEDTAQLLLPKINKKGDKVCFNYNFEKKQMDNILELENEIESKNLTEKEKYIFYANLYYLKSFIYYDKKNYEKANNYFDKGNYYSFYSNKNNIIHFIEENYLNPDILYKKIKDLKTFYINCYDEEKKIEVFEILNNNIKKIEEEFKNNKNISNLDEKLSALNFFRSISLIMTKNKKYLLDYLNCRKNIINYYSKNNSVDAKIAYLSFLNIYKNELEIELEKDEKQMAEGLYNNLSDLQDTNILYKNAQYQCAKYIEKEDVNKAMKHFENSAFFGYDKSKIGVLKYYLEEYNKAEENCVKEDRKKDIELLLSTLPEEYNEEKAEIYEQINDYEKAIKCYNKIIEKADNKKNYIDGSIKLKKFFTKIGDCFTKLGDESFNKYNVNNEKSINFYKEAIKNYIFSGNGNSNKAPTIETIYKIATNYKKINNFEEYKYKIMLIQTILNNFTEKKLKNMEKYNKGFLANLYFELSQNKDIIYIPLIKNGNIEKKEDIESKQIKKSKKYLKMAVDLDCQEAIIEYIDILLKDNKNFRTKNKIFNLLNKLITPEAKFKAAKKLEKLYKNMAFKLLKEASNLGNLDAKYELAVKLKSGLDIKKDEKKAIELFECVSKNSSDLNIKIESLMALGDIYFLNKNFSNLQDAKYYYNKAIDICNLKQSNETTLKVTEIKIKRKILDFGVNTNDEEIKEVTNNMFNYLCRINLDQKEKVEKFNRFVNFLNLKISKYKKKLVIKKMEKINRELNINEIIIKKIR